MKIRMTTSMAGVDFVLAVGEETARFGDAESLRIIQAGYAVAVDDPEVERAAKRIPAREKRKA